MNRTQRGRFTISDIFVTSSVGGEENFETVRQVMKECVILRAEHNLCTQELEYYAISEHFAPVKEGAITPEYSVSLNHGKVEFIRK